jgi:hypothetical protein
MAQRQQRAETCRNVLNDLNSSQLNGFFPAVVIAKYDFPTRAVCIRVEWRAEGWSADNSTILIKTNDSRIYNLSVHRAEGCYLFHFGTPATTRLHLVLNSCVSNKGGCEFWEM